MKVGKLSAPISPWLSSALMSSRVTLGEKKSAGRAILSSATLTVYIGWVSFATTVRYDSECESANATLNPALINGDENCAATPTLWAACSSELAISAVYDRR